MFKHIKILGNRYRIVTSLENMCRLEQTTGTNLILGVPPEKVNLQFLRDTISELVEDEQGNHISSEVLEMLFQKDISEAQKVFTAVYAEMYHLPKPDTESASKNRHCLHTMKQTIKGLFLMLWRHG